jgi:hypothetical protein
MKYTRKIKRNRKRNIKRNRKSKKRSYKHGGKEINPDRDGNYIEQLPNSNISTIQDTPVPPPPPRDIHNDTLSRRQPTPMTNNNNHPGSLNREHSDDMNRLLGFASTSVV